MSLFVSVALLAFLGFLVFREGMDREAEATSESTPQTVQVQMDSLQVDGDQLSFKAKNGDHLYRAFYRILSKEEKEHYQTLTGLIELEIDGELTMPSQEGNFEGFSYQEYLRHQGIFRILTISRIRSMRPVRTWNLLDHLRSWRRIFIVSISERFPDPMRHYMTGLLFGFLGKDFDQMSNLYTSLGIIHLFALSGMQVGFFLGLFRGSLLRLGVRQEIVRFLQFPFSVVYAGLTGFSISVIRALVQSVFRELGLGKHESFACTLFFCLLLDYRMLLTVGGVLTFAFSFLLTVVDFSHLQAKRKKMVEIFLIPLGTFPILIYFFSSFQILSIPLTLVFSYLFDVLILPGLLFIFLLSPVFNCSWVNPFFQLLEGVIQLLARLFPRPWILGKPSILCFFLMITALVLLHDFYKEKKIRIVASLLFVLSIVLTKYPLENEVTIVNVGQGDSILLRDWRGHTVLIDTGGKVTFEKDEWKIGSTTSNAERTLIPYLHSRGIDRIDQLIVTHTDTDHVGDLLEVAESIDVREIWVSSGSLTQEQFVQQLKKGNRAIHVAKEGERLPIFDSYLQVFRTF
ncbi:Late competence protein ComEC, DNA transport [Streptococcus sp. DD13]|nr:Late competence protein ComEC, DNA transport [Streptococcus sp. DD13]